MFDFGVVPILGSDGRHTNQVSVVVSNMQLMVPPVRHESYFNRATAAAPKFLQVRSTVCPQLFALNCLPSTVCPKLTR